MSFFQRFCLLCLGLLLVAGCSGVVNLRTYTDPNGVYSFAYPNGMVKVIVDTNDSDSSTTVVLRDLVYETENVSLMMAPFDRADSIQEMGSPEEVGQRVAAKILAPEGSGRTATLLSTSQIEDQGQMYYLFEYETRLGSQQRHETVGITVFRHRLYTLTASTLESRWSKVKSAFYGVAQSLRVG